MVRLAITARISASVLTVALMSSVATAALPAIALGNDDEVVQSPDEARESDLRAVAEGNGWTVAQARTQDEAWREVARINRQVSAEQRDIYIGAALSETPGGAPSLYIKGPAPKWVRDLVDAAAVPIKIVDDQPYSFDELEQRKDKVHQALVDMGYEAVATGVNITGAGEIRPVVLKTPGLPTNLASILEGIPERLRSSVDVRVTDKWYGSGDDAIGGAYIWNTANGNFCTSGYAVQHRGTGQKGVVSAGHCEGMNRIQPSDPHVLTPVEKHLGTWGDVRWYTTNTTEEPRFRSNPGTVRDVMWLEQIEDITVGRSLCLYGQASNEKNCTLEVEDPSQSCTSGTTSLGHMVLMNGDVGEHGDSGGPWFWNNTAVGVHHGACFVVFGDAFTPVDNLTRAHSLYVEVMKAQ
jgi:streptogrisin C